ncbi:MAG TPA: alpha/beta hydrolase, partial [Candidatus Dormibacteraeota bacterium]|nr:alpha/beta hydrolase [Candidatus Dormibacteraeota bacterium]
SAAIDGDGAADADMRARRRSGESWFSSAYAALISEERMTSDSEFKAHMAKILPFYFADVAKIEQFDFDRETFSAEADMMMSVNKESFSHGVLDRLPALDLPAVIAVGDDDFVCSPVQAMRIHLPLKGSKLVIVDDAGHFPWLENPAMFYTSLESALQRVGAISAGVSA